MLNQHIPKQVQPTLEAYVQFVNRDVANFLGAFYVVGSIALDEFNERFSDIDFVAALNHEASKAEIERLRHIHQKIEKEFPRWKLSGEYFQWSEIGCSEEPSNPYLRYHDRKLHTDECSEANLITWWILKNHGIAVFGTKPQDLDFLVDWDVLIQRMKKNLNFYWVGWTKRLGRRLVLLSDWGIQWTVLGVLRQYYTFRESSMTTKVKAGEYALNHLPTRWHRLIQEAIHIREGNGRSLYRSRVLRMREATKFLRYVIQTCNADF